MIDYDELWRRLNDMYPFGYGMARTISNNFTKIYKDVLPDGPELKEENRTLAFTVGLDKDGNPVLGASHRSMILFAEIAESILELIKNISGNKENLEDIEKNFILKEKICQNPECGAINKVTAKFCDSCGLEFGK